MIAGKVNNGPVVVGAPAEAHIVAGSVKKIELTGTVEKGYALAGTVAPEKTLQGAVFVGGGADGGDLSKITVRSQAATVKQVPAPGYYGIGEVIVEGDPDLVPENIKDGVNILGVRGTYKPPEPEPTTDVKLTTRKVTIKENGSHVISTPAGYVGMTQVTAVVDVPVDVTEEKVDANFQEKTVTPTAGGHVVTPDEDEGYNALSRVVVTGDAELKPDNIRKGATIFGVAGEYEKTEVLEAVMQVKSVTPTAGGFTVKPDEGVDGLSSVTVAGDSDLIPANVREGVEIFGVKGSYSSGQKYQTKNVTPTRGGVSVTADSGYNALAQVKVEGDQKLVPENIAKGVTIFGVVGSYVSPMKPIEVISGHQDEQYIVPAAGYAGFSAVSVKPYDPTPHYDAGYEAGREAGFREACEANGVEPIAYMYNAYRYPKLPDADPARPYAVLFYESVTKNVLLGVCSTVPELGTATKTTGLNFKSSCLIYTLADDSWGEPTSYSSKSYSTVSASNLRWCNTDIYYVYYEDNVAREASDPVPVYRGWTTMFYGEITTGETASGYCGYKGEFVRKGDLFRSNPVKLTVNGKQYLYTAEGNQVGNKWLAELSAICDEVDDGTDYYILSATNTAQFYTRTPGTYQVKIEHFVT